MTLKEKFRQELTGHLSDEKTEVDVNIATRIAEEFAIGFAEWKEAIRQDENGMYFSESRIQVSRKNPIDIKKLLEIYKKEKGL